MTIYTPRLEKNIPNNIDYHFEEGISNFNNFGTNIFGTSGHQMTVQYSTSPNVCFCTTWGKIEPTKHELK